MARRNFSVESFLAGVRSHLNRHRLWTTVIWTATAAAGALALAGLWYTLRGHAVPREAIWGTLLAATAIGGAAVLLRRLSTDAAARAADRIYHLHDAITSYLHFARSGRVEGYYALQAQQTQDRVKPLDPAAIRYEPPRRVMMLAAGLFAIAIPLGLQSPSPARLAEQQLAEDTAQATATINEELAKLVDEIEEAAPNAAEKELIDPNELRKLVEELAETPDHKEALRQYAQLERKLNETRLSLQNKRDQQLLERAAREMEATRETQPLAEQLKQKDYDRSAELLEKMQPQSIDAPLSKQRQELARLKAAAQHMAAAARSARFESSSAKAGAANSSNASNSSASASTSSGEGGAGSGSSDGQDMAQTMEELATQVSEFDRELDEAQRQESQDGQCDAKQRSKCENCSQSVSQSISKLSKQLNKLAMCQRADARLCKLCQACSQCQGNLNSLCNSPNAGGKNAGTGTNAARRSQLDELIDNGQTTRLEGQKGRGPSLTTVESADDGSGVSSRRATARARTFKRQLESFVAREDVPEEVKDGVKQYFQIIHEISPESATQEPGNDADHGT